MFDLDTSTEWGNRVLRRLQAEEIIWLVTVDADGTPQPSPVWFLWDGETMLIYSKPNTPKIRNIERQPRVSLHFDGDGSGGNIIVFSGTATLAPHAPPATQVAAYMDKYRAGIARIGMDPDSFAALYSLPLSATPTKVRGH